MGFGFFASFPRAPDPILVLLEVLTSMGFTIVEATVRPDLDDGSAVPDVAMPRVALAATISRIMSLTAVLVALAAATSRILSATMAANEEEEEEDEEEEEEEEKDAAAGAIVEELASRFLTPPARRAGGGGGGDEEEENAVADGDATAATAGRVADDRNVWPADAMRRAVCGAQREMADD